jgi:hypothetical protein
MDLTSSFYLPILLPCLPLSLSFLPPSLSLFSERGAWKSQNREWKTRYFIKQEDWSKGREGKKANFFQMERHVWNINTAEDFIWPKWNKQNMQFITLCVFWSQLYPTVSREMYRNSCCSNSIVNNKSRFQQEKWPWAERPWAKHRDAEHRCSSPQTKVSMILYWSVYRQEWVTQK